MSNLGYRQEMIRHLRLMEAAQTDLDQMERDALHRAQESRARRISSQLGRTTPAEYWAAKELEENFWYKKLASTRDGHRRAVQVYALAAIASGPTMNPRYRGTDQ